MTTPSERVAVVGSRNYPDLGAVRRYVRSLPAGTTVVSGGAHGVDRAAQVAAEDRGLPTLIFPAQWAKYGKQAGFHRNADIVANADRVVAFTIGSPGTAHTIEIAHRLGLPVEVIRFGDAAP